MRKKVDYGAAFKKPFDDAEKGRTATVHPLRKILADENQARVLLVPLEKITPDPDQPRKHFDTQALEDLTSSVKEKGILQPVIARKDPAGGDGVILIAGERRYRAAKAAGLKEMPVLLRTPDDAREVSLIENLQRENLNPIEEAEALLALKKERGYTDAQLAKIVGKSRSAITEALSLAQLPEPVKAECRSTDIWTKTQLLHVLRAGNSSQQTVLWDALKKGEVPSSAHALRAHKQKAAEAKRPTPYAYHFTPDTKTYRLSVTFKKSRVTRDELRDALKAALKDIRD